jgi:glycosyltransferase involved in cell wall biosynthesis
MQVDLDDDRQIGQAMVQVCEDDGLRDGLIAKARERSRRFSWDTSARQLLALYAGSDAS